MSKFKKIKKKGFSNVLFYDIVPISWITNGTRVFSLLVMSTPFFTNHTDISFRFTQLLMRRSMTSWTDNKTDRLIK